jgi:hypothetical protein
MPESANPSPQPLTPGPEMAALRRFLRDVTWSGSIEAGQMGPGSPKLTARGEGAHHAIQDGSWIVGDYEQTQSAADGSHYARWQLHMVCGWSPLDQTYVALTADNYGRALAMKGRIDCDRLVFETASQGMKFRLTWDASSPGVIHWRNETSPDGKTWSLVESYLCKPV